MRSIARRCVPAALIAMLITTTASAMPPQPEGDPHYWSLYCQGLLSLRDGHYPDAVTSFTAAIELNPDPHAYLARAVAFTCNSDFAKASNDLSHANMPNSREPRLWEYAIWAMADIAPREERNANNPGGTRFAGLPGYIVQGKDDYPTDYASCVAYELGMAYNRARLARENLNSPALRAAALKAASWFANRGLATKEMAAFNVQFARDFLDKKQFSETLATINLAKAVFPFDADIRFISAEALRQIGRPESARREYTVALTMATDSAPAYRGRALAAAAGGDAHRALTDLASAARYDAASTSDAPLRVGELLQINHDFSAADLSKLDAAALAGGSVEKTLPLAIDLQKNDALARLRFDEIYQDRLRTLEDATRSSPNNPDTFVAFASYILDELNNRGEAIEPRRGMQFYRYQYSQDMEISRAIFALNRALKINPKLPTAIIRLAFAFDAQGNTGQAEDCINEAMAIVGTSNPEAIRLLAQYRSEQAGSLLSHARHLRTPTFITNTHSENRSDGVYNVTTTTRYDPSPADLQNADQCEAQAHALISEAKTMMESAIKSSPNTLEGLLLQSSYAQWFGTTEQSLAALQKAVEKYPQSLKAHDALIDYYSAHLLADQVIEERLIADKLFQTTAAPLLERIWRDIHVNGWPALMADVRRARTEDPADARTTAYLAAAEADNNDDAKSAAHLRVAIALELARIQLDDQGPSVQYPRPASDFALVMRLYSLTSAQAIKAGNVAQALADSRAAAAFAARFAPGGAGEPMYTAMLPDPNAEQIPVPAPVNGATLAAEANVNAGEILKSQNDFAGALTYFRIAAALGQPRDPRIPMVGNGRGETNYSDRATGPIVVLAFLELARVQLAQGDLAGASTSLNTAGNAHPTRDQLTELNDLQLQVARKTSEQRMQNNNPQPYQPPPMPQYQPPPPPQPRQPAPRPQLPRIFGQ